jgi:hypothetical protein
MEWINMNKDVVLGIALGVAGTLTAVIIFGAFLVGGH